MVNRRKLYRDKLAQLLVNNVKLVFVVSFHDFFFELRELTENPAVETGEFVISHGMFRRIKIVKIRELIAQRVADAAICFGHLVNALFAYDDIAAEILR